MLTQKKKGAPVLPQTEAPIIPPKGEPSNTPIIDDKAPKNKGKQTKNRGGLTMASTVPDLSIKVYEEQIEGGFPALFERIRALDKKEWQALAIVHDEDEVPEEIFEPAYKKPHVHVLDRRADHKDRRKVSTFLNALGIVFRPGLDDEIWKNRGVERIQDIGASVAYLTHETQEAEKAGKHIYERDRIVSNLDPDEINQLREGYLRIVPNTRRVDLKTQAELAQAAYDFGYTGKLWEEFEASLPFVLQKGQSYNLYIRKYNEGLTKRMEEKQAINRLSIFIQGPPNVGKTYGARETILQMGLSLFFVNSGTKTAKFDSLRESHDAILVDDANLGNLLDMTDNRAIAVYKRQKGVPWWCGSLLVICSNKSIDDYLKACNILDKDEIEAAKSRLYICRVVVKDGKPSLILDSYSERGTPAEQEERAKLFKKFAHPMVESMQTYSAMKKDKADYSILDEFIETEPRQMTLKELAPKPVRKLHYRDPETMEIYDDIGKTDVRKVYEEGYIEGGVFLVQGHTIALLDDEEDEPLPFG